MAFSTVVVSAPSPKREGELVPFSVIVVNIDPVQYNSFRTKVFLGNSLFRQYEDFLPPYLSAYHSEVFYMPPFNVTILAWVEVWRNAQWGYDSSASAAVELYVPTLPPPIPPPPPTPEFSNFAITGFSKV